MKDSKYGHLLYRFQPGHGQALSAQAADIPHTAMLGGADQPGAPFQAAYYVLTTPGVLLEGTHRHSQETYLMFGSTDLRRSGWDARLELTLGEGGEAEVLHICEPTTVRIPAGLAHGPLKLLRAAKPVVYQPTLIAETRCDLPAAAPAPDGRTGRYEKLLFRNRTERKGNYIDGSKIVEKEDDLVGIGFRGACQIGGSTVNIGGSLIEAPLFIDPYPHYHPADEFLAFMGRPEAPFDFDAEISFTLGNGDDAETFVITEPTIVWIPKDTWHCPLNFVRIGKPVYFQVSMLQGAFGGTYQMPGGEKDLYFNGLIDCILNPHKQCDCCHQCLHADWKSA